MHAHALTRLLVTLADPAAASPLLRGLVEKDKLLAYQFAFDLVEGGAQDFLETVRNDLPQDGVRAYERRSAYMLMRLRRSTRRCTTNSGTSSPAKSRSSCTSSS
jgi:hypothetical protein